MEAQEGKDFMGEFEFVSDCNKSSAWLLRLSKPWFGTGRTVIADAAFAQVRAAFMLMKNGLYMIGNVKGNKMFFPQDALREECGEYEANKLVCLTKKATVKLDNSNEFEIFATGWRATGKMVCTYVHTHAPPTRKAPTARRRRSSS